MAAKVLGSARRMRVGDDLAGGALVGEQACGVVGCRGGCSRCGWAGGRGFDRRSRCNGRGRGCRGGGLGARCRLGRRRRCAPRRARRSVCRRAGSRRRTSPGRKTWRPSSRSTSAPPAADGERWCRWLPLKTAAFGSGGEVGVDEDAITGGVGAGLQAPARTSEWWGRGAHRVRRGWCGCGRRGLRSRRG